MYLFLRFFPKSSWLESLRRRRSFVFKFRKKENLLTVFYLRNSLNTHTHARQCSKCSSERRIRTEIKILEAQLACAIFFSIRIPRSWDFVARFTFNILFLYFDFLPARMLTNFLFRSLENSSRVLASWIWIEKDFSSCWCSHQQCWRLVYGNRRDKSRAKRKFMKISNKEKLSIEFMQRSDASFCWLSLELLAIRG